LKPQHYVKLAIDDITAEVKKILEDQSKSLTEKDNLIFPFVQQKKVLQQTLEDLDFLENRKIEESTTCKMSSFR
jgi:hypothetical protein